MGTYVAWGFIYGTHPETFTIHVNPPSGAPLAATACLSGFSVGPQGSAANATIMDYTPRPAGSPLIQVPMLAEGENVTSVTFGLLALNLNDGEAAAVFTVYF
jgi:hypothetical protein